MNEYLARHVFFPLHEKMRGRPTLRYLAELHETQAISGAALLKFQQQKLGQLIEYCRKEVPFYKERIGSYGISAGADGNHITGIGPLERDEIRVHSDEMLSPGMRDGLIRYNTGGSTGEPLVFYTDKVKEARHNAYKLRCRQWFGIEPGDRQIDVWGSPIELSKQSYIRAWKDRVLLNHRLLSAFDLTTERLLEYARIIAEHRPRLIYGYPTAILRIADVVLDSGFDMKGYRPMAVICTSEMLFEHQREKITEAFQCPVFNEYGARDGGLIAHECTAGRLHIAAEHVLVEVDNPDESGIGDLLITNLDGYGMPLLRYRIGDRGKLSSDEESCECGLALPVLSELCGRQNDFVVGENGKLIHSLGPIYVLREIENIKQFKIIQDRNLDLTVLVVPRSDLTGEERSRIETRLQQLMGETIKITIETTMVIPPESSGKYRWVVSQAVNADA